MEDVPQVQDVDYTVVSGDFNTTGDVAKEQFAAQTPVLLWSADKQRTTQTGHQRDNVLFSDALGDDVRRQVILTQKILSHYPLVVTLKEKE